MFDDLFVDVEQAAIPIVQENQVIGVFKQVSVLFFFFPQAFNQLHPLGNLPHQFSIGANQLSSSLLHLPLEFLLMLFELFLRLAPFGNFQPHAAIEVFRKLFAICQVSNEALVFKPEHQKVDPNAIELCHGNCHEQQEEQHHHSHGKVNGIANQEEMNDGRKQSRIGVCPEGLLQR